MLCKKLASRCSPLFIDSHDPLSRSNPQLRHHQMTGRRDDSTLRGILPLSSSFSMKKKSCSIISITKLFFPSGGRNFCCCIYLSSAWVRMGWDKILLEAEESEKHCSPSIYDIFRVGWVLINSIKQAPRAKL